MKTSQIDDLVKQFADNVVEQTRHTMTGDSEQGNLCAKKYIAAFESLRAVGDQGRDALARLFDHPRPDVRSMAAAFLLRYRTKEALRVLKAVAKKEPGFSAFCASEAIKRWKEGAWELDPEEM